MTAICNIYFTPTKVTSFVEMNVYTSILFSFSFSKEYRWQGSWQPQWKLQSRRWSSTVYASSPHSSASSNNCTTCCLSTHTMFTGPDLHRVCRCRKHGVCMTSHSVIPCTMLVSSVILLSLSIPKSRLTTWGNLQVHLSTPCICWYICRCKPPKPSSTAAVRQTSSTNIVSKSCLRHEPGQSNKP